METFLNHLKGPSVLVRVGQNQELREFTAPKGLLVQQGKWFAGALKEDAFAEGESGVINMPEDDPKAFEAFNYHVYNNCLAFQRFDYEKSPERSFEDLRISIETWIFADKYGLHHLQDCAMYSICTQLWQASKSSVVLPSRFLVSCFSKTMLDSSLRKLAGDYVITKMEEAGSDTTELLEGLAPLSGSFATLYESKNRYDTDEYGKLPRFELPRKYTAILGSDASSGEEKDGWLTFTLRWRSDVLRCSACGFECDYDTEAECVSCALKGQPCVTDCQNIGFVCSSCDKT